MQGHDKLPKELATRPGTEGQATTRGCSIGGRCDYHSAFLGATLSSNERKAEKLREEPWLARAIADLYEAGEGLGQRT